MQAITERGFKQWLRVRKYLKDGVEPVYKRKPQAGPQLGPWCGRLDEWLRSDGLLPKARQRTARRLFECLQAEGYAGAYDSVQRHVRQWKIEAGRATSTKAFVPLFAASGDVAQFDWSYEHVVLGGTTATIKLAHFRLAYSRQMFVVAYPREAQEMVLDAHNPLPPFTVCMQTVAGQRAGECPHSPRGGLRVLWRRAAQGHLRQ